MYNTTNERVEAFKNRMADFEEMAVLLKDAPNAEKVFSKWKDEGREYNVFTSKGRKKYYKDKFKREFPKEARRPAEYPPEFVNKFIRTDDEGERKVTVWIFKNVPGVIDKIKMNMHWEATQNYYNFSPTGLWFREQANFHIFGDRVFVVQSSFLDC